MRRFESFREANARAAQVAVELHRLAEAHGRVVVFGYGLLNRQVASHLLRLGWRGARRRRDYWGLIDLDRPTG